MNMTSNMSSTSSSTPTPDKEVIDLEAQTPIHKLETHNTAHQVAHVENDTEDPDLIRIGDAWVSRRELIQAFGGTLNPGLAAAPSRKFANPAPLGLCAFGLTTFVLCMANVQARGVTNPSVVIGCAYFYGGFIQLCAGMWEMVLENTFGATALSSFGGFWLAFGAIETDAFGIVSAYGDDTNGLNNMLAFFLLAWFIFTFGLVLCTLRSTVGFFLLFFTLDIAFLLLGVGHLYPTDAGGPNVGITKAGGVFGLLSAFFAWYNAFAGLATKENSLITVKPIPMPWNLGHLANKRKSG